MPTVSLSLSSLLDIASLIPSALMEGGSGQDFLSLLNTSTSQLAGASSDHQPSSPKSNSQDQNTQVQVATLLSLPAPTVNNTPAANSNPPAPSSVQSQQQPQNTPHGNANASASSQGAPAAANANNQNTSQNSNQGNNAQSNQSSSNTASSNTPSSATQPSNTQSSAQDVSQPATVNAADQTGSGGTTQDAQQLRDQLRSELAGIDQILLAIMQALAGAGAATAQTVTGSTTDTTAAVADTGTAGISADGNSSSSSLANLLLQWQAQLQQAADAQASALLGVQGGNTLSTDASATDTTGTASLISDMQALLAQLQQELQPLSDQNQPALQQQPGQALAQSLTQLLMQQTSSATQTQTITSSPSLTDLGAMLKNDIAQARNTLQQLQAVNQTLYNNAQSSLQAQLSSSSAGQPVKDALANLAGLLLAKDVPSPAPATPDNSASTANNTPVPQNAPVLPPVVTLQFVAQPAVTLNAAQGGAGNSGGNSSGNQEQGLPQIVMPTASAPSQPTASTGAASFANMLEQASPGSLLDQVVFNIKTAVDDGSSKIHIQLEPADLGKLDIRLDVSADGKTGVVITADNKNTLSLLQQNASGLTRALSDAGLSTDSGSLSFNLGGQNPNSGQGQAAPQAAFTYQKSQPDDAADATAIGTVVSRSYVVNLTQGLDITI